MNSPASDPQGFGHKADSSIPQRVGFRSSPTPPRALIEQRGQGCIFASNECHLFFPRHAANLLAASFLFKLFFLETLQCHASCTLQLLQQQPLAGDLVIARHRLPPFSRLRRYSPVATCVIGNSGEKPTASRSARLCAPTKNH